MKKKIEKIKKQGYGYVPTKPIELEKFADCYEFLENLQLEDVKDGSFVSEIKKLGCKLVGKRYVHQYQVDFCYWISDDEKKTNRYEFFIAFKESRPILVMEGKEQKCAQYFSKYYDKLPQGIKI